MTVVVSALGLFLAAAPATEDNVLWFAPPSCPDKAGFLSRLRARLGPGPHVPHQVAVDVWRDTQAAMYMLRLYWSVADQPMGRREVADASCDALTDLAAELVALAVTEGDEHAGATMVCPAAPAPKPEPTRPQPAPLWLTLGFGPGFGYGQTPQLGAVMEAAAGILGRGFSVGVQSHVRFEQRTRLQGAVQGARVLAWGMGPQACFVAHAGAYVAPETPRLLFPVCGQALLGELRARPFGLDAPAQARDLWANVGARIGMAVAIFPQLAVRFDATGFVNVVRPAFDTRDGNEIVRAAPGGFSAVLGVYGRLALRRKASL